MMPTTAPAASVALFSGKLPEIQADLIVVPVFEGESAATATPELNEGSGGSSGSRSSTEAGESHRWRRRR